ncbi:hypothetical protein K458DRAFT_126747 [Lentithecium fluviatile CBS 122367]|uniref:Uncharacterized protein n=1 Tax=Lentithecium fluviatile CBS 122367 TaxID=1168545 RepID=A0A6G1JGT4_9PLEO|nr:hypothetical protein K458DRAFT_126747 [Lentithecium fluviatile CBS 122367]
MLQLLLRLPGLNSAHGHFPEQRACACHVIPPHLLMRPAAHRRFCVCPPVVCLFGLQSTLLVEFHRSGPRRLSPSPLNCVRLRATSTSPGRTRPEAAPRALHSLALGETRLASLGLEQCQQHVGRERGVGTQTQTGVPARRRAFCLGVASSA